MITENSGTGVMEISQMNRLKIGDRRALNVLCKWSLRSSRRKTAHAEAKMQGEINQYISKEIYSKVYVTDKM